MKTNSSSILNPIKMKHNNSFILSAGEYIGTYNKNNEKINSLQFDLETTKDTIIKLRSEINNKNKEINTLKFNEDDKKKEYQNTLKVIETVLKIIDGDSQDNKENKNEDDNNHDNNIKKNDSIENNNKNNIKEEEEEKEKEKEEEEEKQIEKEKVKEKESNNTNNKLPPISSGMELSPKRINRTNKEQSYVGSLKTKINLLKELIAKKDDEIKEMQKNKTNLNYFKLQNNLEKNYNEFTNIRKQNELMKTKIEDVTNLLFMEKEGNKNLKSKLQVFQSSFKDFQESAEKKNTDLELKLFQVQERQRDCKIFHVRRSSAPEKKRMGSRSTSRVNMDELDDNERLKIAEKEIKSIKLDIDNLNKDISNKNSENEQLKSNKSELEKKVNELKERNSKLKNEINNLNKNVKELNTKANNLEKQNKEIKNKLNSSNNKLTNEQKKTAKMKDNLNKKENEISELKKEIEKLKESNNFKDGMFFTSIGAKGKTKNDNLEDADINIDEELAQIEKKYNMINEQNKNKEEVANNSNKMGNNKEETKQ